MLKIAFCDDENQETRRLEALLEEYAADRGQDFAHTSYQSPVELMAEVEKGTRFDIILLDVLMPGENGMAAAREIREYDSNEVLLVQGLCNLLTLAIRYLPVLRSVTYC